MFIPNDQIDRSQTRLGKGQNGQAFLAKYQNRQVCLKSCPQQGKPGAAGNDNLVKGVFKEAYRMRQFEHQNVMRVIGVSLDIKNSPEIILPLMDERDLLAYLRTRNNIISYKTVSKKI